jgi:hypothetical protein
MPVQFAQTRDPVDDPDTRPSTSARTASPATPLPPAPMPQAPHDAAVISAVGAARHGTEAARATGNLGRPADGPGRPMSRLNTAPFADIISK